MEMDWVGAPIGVQKSLILVMARALRPVYITAGKFVAISIETFMSVSILNRLMLFLDALSNIEFVKSENTPK